ncbi:MAG TPA: hypothetical protein VHA78_00485 [Candidatus Peribacteraceae bacterium]|nr:hypothetical protein [Candidatus Peribacteraceae bacterium]
MSNTNTQTEAEDALLDPSVPNNVRAGSARSDTVVCDVAETTILERIATPMLLFSGALFVLLMFSWLFILPRFTRFDVAGASLTPLEMAAYTQQQNVQLATLEQKRDELVLPQTDPTYTALKSEKNQLPDPLLIRTALINAAGTVVTGDATIAIKTLDVDSATNVVSITGDVVTKDPSSMTQLAAYIDAVEKMPFVSHLQRPSFTRTQDGSGNFHSPFSMQFIFSPAQ